MKQKSKILKEVIGLSFLFLFLAGTMCIPGNVILAEASGEYGTLVDHGTCGAAGNEEGITWEAYDSDTDDDVDTIVFDGNGDMDNFSWDGSPCYAHRNSLTKVVFKEGNGITNIGENAFYECSSLTSVEIPAGVKRIEQWEFGYCSSLTSLKIPSSVMYISSYAFFGCKKLSIQVEEANIEYSAENGILYNKKKSFLISAPSATGNIKIPSEVKMIEVSAFRGCSSLSSVEIPSKVTRIGGQAFMECSSLSSVEIPSGVKSIEFATFARCSSLSSVEKKYHQEKKFRY